MERPNIWPLTFHNCVKYWPRTKHYTTKRQYSWENNPLFFFLEALRSFIWKRQRRGRIPPPVLWNALPGNGESEAWCLVGQLLSSSVPQKTSACVRENGAHFEDVLYGRKLTFEVDAPLNPNHHRGCSVCVKIRPITKFFLDEMSERDAKEVWLIVKTYIFL